MSNVATDETTSNDAPTEQKLLSTKEACEVAGTTKELLFAISERENLGPDGMRPGADRNMVAYWHQETAEAIRDVLAADMARVDAIVEAHPGRYAPGAYRFTDDGQIRPIPIAEAIADLDAELVRRDTQVSDERNRS